MSPLRQRLLLVAGWVIAAVATGLVSAGAVAVAGGQVRDRPLRPLSAAEVAALPVLTTDDCVASGPLASGGSVGGTRCPGLTGSDSRTAGGDVTAQPAEKEFLERGDLSDPLAPGRFPRGVITPPIEPHSAEPVVVDLVGGRVSVSVDDAALVLNSATPRPGFVADLLFERDDELTVTFWDGNHLSVLTASVGADGALQLGQSEAPD